MSYDFNFTEEGYEVSKPYDFWFYYFIEFGLLPDSTDNLISISVDTDTSFDTGYLYITMKNHFVVVNMESKSIVDMYSFNSKGKSGDTLTNSEIKNSDISK